MLLQLEAGAGAEGDDKWVRNTNIDEGMVGGGAAIAAMAVMENRYQSILFKDHNLVSFQFLSNC